MKKEFTRWQVVENIVSQKSQETTKRHREYTLCENSVSLPARLI